MAEHEPSLGGSDEWYTTLDIFEALGLRFDLDPCSPGSGQCFVPADRVFIKADDGLAQSWSGLVFMNPPFGGRNGHTPWLEKFIQHGNGIGIVRAYTSSGWWHQYIPRIDAIEFPAGKTKFIRPDGPVGRSPGHGVALLAMGRTAIEALRLSGLGMFFPVRCRA